MEKIFFDQSVIEEVLNLIKKNNEYDSKIKRSVEYVTAKINIYDIFYPELETKKINNVLCMYHEVNLEKMSKFFNIKKVSLDEENFGISNDPKIILKVQYDIEYKDIYFALLVVYEFDSFKLKSNNFFVEPWLFFGRSVETTLVLDNEVLLKKKNVFYISNEMYLENVSKFEFCIKPQSNSREYEVVISGNGSIYTSKNIGDFNEVIKSLLDIFLENSKNINDMKKKKDLIIETRKTRKSLNDVNVVSDLFYQDVKVGQVTKKDTLYKYEVILKLDGIDKCVKVYVYLTDFEYNGIVKLNNLVTDEFCFDSVNANESSYVCSDTYFLKNLYFSKAEVIESYIKNRNYKKILESSNEIEEILSKCMSLNPIVIDISDKNLPFSNVILYNNILRVKRKDMIGSIKIYNMIEEKIIYEKEKMYIINKYIIIVDDKAYEVELISNLAQGIYSSLNFEINLPVFYTKEVTVYYRFINSKYILENFTYFCVFNEPEVVKDIFEKTTLKARDIKLDIDMHYEKYFNNISFGFSKDNNLMEEKLENTLNFLENFDIYDFVTNSKKNIKKIIGVREDITLYGDTENEIEVFVFTEEYYLGKASFETDNPLTFEICENKDNKKPKSIVEMNLSRAYLGMEKPLYDIFLARKTEISPSRIDVNDKLTKEYINSIIDWYNSDNS